jgi:multidrug resistance efflux pump
VERAASLIKTGSVSTVELARLTREQSIAQRTETGAQRRLDAAKVELTAAKNGTYLGDSYNDRPSSVQREEEMRQRGEDLKADLMHADAEIDWLSHEITSEQLHYISRSETDIKAPVTGRIWEMMTSPGEDVRAGQALLKLLDCSGLVVTANVTENVYNRLGLGEQARFEPNDGSTAIQGSIVNLTGASGAPANLAINPDTLNKEPYRVTVSMPGIDETGKDCAVGRTGRVVFNKDASNK